MEQETCKHLVDSIVSGRLWLMDVSTELMVKSLRRSRDLGVPCADMPFIVGDLMLVGGEIEMNSRHKGSNAAQMCEALLSAVTSLQCADECARRAQQKRVSWLQRSARGQSLAGELAPMHADTKEQQLSQAPVLASLTEHDRQELADSFSAGSKDQSFLQWCMSNLVVMASSPDNVTAAMQSKGLVTN